MPKTKRLAYDAEFKLKAIELAEGKGNRKAAFELGIHESMVRKWRKQKTELGACKRTRRAFRGCAARWPELEAQLVDWVHIQRAASRGLSTVQVQLKAIEMARTMGIDNFVGGATWCYRFMKRNNLSMRTKTTLCQEIPADLLEKTTLFRNFVSELIAEEFIGLDFIVNMDEVPLSFDMPLTRTINKKGESSVSIKTTGHEKSNFTCVLACTASGIKLPPMLIFKRKTMPKEKFPAGIVIKVNVKGWMDETMMHNWLAECFTKRPGGFFRRAKTLLVMDSMRAHITVGVKQAVKSANALLAVIPGGTTKFLQPLDISVNRSFKASLCKLWERWMTEGEHSFTKTGRMRRASLAEVASWVVQAWEEVPIRVIIKAFQKAEIVADDSADLDSPSSENENDPTDTNAHPAMTDEAMRAIFHSDTEDSDFSGFSGNEGD
ncbi:hypothetical protein V1264_022083 [Littorina saxatilis]|uniref:HTH CENPB-type domain-containing protein n=1 Tax=Littorina saxatilis TaxID=31220 RepID=A0AAN9AJS5_9CAEN